MASMFEVGSAGRQGGRSDPRRNEGRDPSPLLLARLIEGEIIPRLLLAHRSDAVAPVLARVPLGTDGDTVAASEAAAFVQLVLDLEVHALLAEVEVFLARGVPVETIYLDLLAPAARGLGVMWDNDTCDFVDVTMGLWRLQQVVHELASRMPAPIETSAKRRAFFTVVPGDQHSFGLVMIEEFFRRSGWTTWSASAPTHADLAEMVARQWFELVGFTVTCAEQIAQLPECIRAVRRASKNQAVAVMVGGRMFVESPALALEVGADGTAADGRQAVALAEALLGAASNSAASKYAAPMEPTPAMMRRRG